MAAILLDNRELHRRTGIVFDLCRALLARPLSKQMTRGDLPGCNDDRQHLRCRCHVAGDRNRALYISELRSGVAGHFSYRRVAWEMYREVAKKHPSLAQYFRIEDVNEPVDLLRR